MKSRIVASVLFLALTAGPAFGQGCAMCLSNAAGAPSDTQRSLRHGIVVLLVPSLGAMVGLITLAYKDRDHFAADEDEIQ